MEIYLFLILIIMNIGIYIIACHLLDIKRELKNVVKLIIVIGDHMMGGKS